MPTVLREGPYRIYFYSHEPGEPAHVHVDRDSSSAKIWLLGSRLANNYGFSASELKKIGSIVRKNQQELWEAWNDYFSEHRG
ncbi:MAG TPA: DUF4160 domain-containing protein [Oceanospirillaceae bacterium]|jgi:hypothetical protein|nr:DUF4160 domain-containing protein [Oceanospirillaceae bacterium]